MLTNYKKLFKEVRNSKFLNLQATVLFLVTYVDWVLIPYVTKLEGTYLPVYMISFFMLLGALDGIIQPMFKHIRIYNIYLFTIILDICQISSYYILNSSIYIFTYVILAVFTIQAITFEIARVHTIDFMQDESIDLKDYLMIRSFVISIAIVCGSISAMLLDYFVIALKDVLIYCALFGVIAIYIQYKLYKKFKYRVNLIDIEIEKEKLNLYEKFK